MSQPIASEQRSAWVVDVPQAGYSCSSSDNIRFLITGIVLTAVAAVAAYFTLVHARQILNPAIAEQTSTAGGWVLFYCGITYSFVAICTALYTGGRPLFHHCKEEPMKYTSAQMVTQIAISILAPIILLPFLILEAVLPGMDMGRCCADSCVKAC